MRSHSQVMSLCQACCVKTLCNKINTYSNLYAHWLCLKSCSISIVILTQTSVYNNNNSNCIFIQLFYSLVHCLCLDSY